MGMGFECLDGVLGFRVLRACNLGLGVCFADPKYDAKMVYTNMYKATTEDQKDTEVFAM